MNRWMAAVLCALLLAPGLLACRSNDAPAADDPVSEQTDVDAAAETSEEAAADDEATDADGDEASDAAQDESATDAGAGDGEEGEPLDEPTPDPTTVALAQSFVPPIKGDPNAPVMIYEFSDFL